MICVAESGEDSVVVTRDPQMMCRLESYRYPLCRHMPVVIVLSELCSPLREQLITAGMS